MNRSICVSHPKTATGVPDAETSHICRLESSATSERRAARPRIARRRLDERNEQRRSSLCERRRRRRAQSASRATRIARRCLDERESRQRFSVCERVRKAAASKRNPQRAERAIKRGASNSTPDRAPQHGEGTSRGVLPSARDDDGGERIQRARAAASGASNSIQCPRWDSNPCWSGFKPPASAIWATGAR